MNLHEYQAKRILKKYGVPISPVYVASTKEEALSITEKLDEGSWVVKAQIHAGGRGKAGGVKLASSTQEVLTHVDSILGATLVTPQTGSKGKLVSIVSIEPVLVMQKELYFSFLLDRSSSRIMLVASQAGGMNIEEVAATMPDKIYTEYIDTFTGLPVFQIRRVLANLGLATFFTTQQLQKAIAFIQSLYQAFIAEDMSLLELNPLAVTDENELAIVDCKMQIDDNALFRHVETQNMQDPKEEDVSELEAQQHGLSFISLDGNIGCMVNGAGLAMGTLDTLSYFGGSPANFLDIGGNATEERVTEAIKLICNDTKVKCIFVNIFGGIVRCDMIAEGVINAIQRTGINLPVIVRLEGAKAQEAKELIEQSPFYNQIKMISDFAEAAKSAILVASKA